QSFADLVVPRYNQGRVSDLFAQSPRWLKKEKKAELMSKSQKASKSNVPKGAIPKGPKLWRWCWKR
ncbi:Hypothetical predicted protein, partial [Olea europaea subsp. europaea]